MKVKVKVYWESEFEIKDLDEYLKTFGATNISDAVVNEFNEDEYAFVEATEPCPVRAEIIP